MANGGDELILLIHVEVQGEAEEEFPLRMFTYNYRIFDRYGREVVSLAVLGDDSATWRPDRFGYARAPQHQPIERRPAQTEKIFRKRNRKQNIQKSEYQYKRDERAQRNPQRLSQ